MKLNSNMRHNKDANYQVFHLDFSSEPPKFSPEMYLFFKEKYRDVFNFVGVFEEWGYSKEDAIKLNTLLNSLDNELG